MALNTPNSSLPYPELTDIPNAQTAFQNLALALDTKVVPKFASSAARDTAIPSPVEGQLCYRTDINGLQEYNGSWRPANIINCTSATRPSSPETGRLIFESDTTAIKRYTGTAWVTLTPTMGAAMKAADTSRASNATFSDDPDLILPVEANSVYSLEMQGKFTSSAGGLLNTRFVFPSGTIENPYLLYFPGGTPTYILLGAGASPSATVTGFPGGTSVFSIFGSLVTAGTAGSLSFQWAQGSSNATPSIIHKGTWMRLTKKSG